MSETCEKCGNIFTRDVKKKYVPKRDFCSENCRKNLYRDEEMRMRIRKGDINNLSVRKIQSLGFRVTCHED